MAASTDYAFIVTHGARIDVMARTKHGAVYGGAPGAPPTLLVECDHLHGTMRDAYLCAEGLFWDIDLPHPVLVNYPDREPDKR
jgi:hypothetical protein